MGKPLLNVFTFDRILFCTKTMDASADKMYLGQGCLTRMSHARSHYYVSLKRHLFRFYPVKKLSDSSTSMIQFDKFPNERVKNLIAVEDLGCGSSGKVWLVTTTETLKSICVFKFDNKTQRFNLDAEAEF